MSAWHVGGTRGSVIGSSAAGVLGISVVREKREVGGVYEMCMCLARGGVGGKGGEWMRGLGLGFTNPVETGGVCLCLGCGSVGGVGGEWGVGMVLSAESGWVVLRLFQVSAYCARRIPEHLRCIQCSIVLHLFDICFLPCICLWQTSKTRLVYVLLSDLRSIQWLCTSMFLERCMAWKQGHA